MTIVNGIDEGWDNFDDTDENVGYTGQAIFTAKDKHTTLNFAWQFSNEPAISGGNTFADPNARHGRFIESTVLSHDWNDRTSYVIESCFGVQAAGDGMNFATQEPEADTATWYGVDGYVTYKQNCCLTLAARFEWFRDTDGTRVAAVGDFATPINNNVASEGGFAGSFYDVTFGWNYHPNANVQFRPEIRYDWYSGARNPFTGGLPYHAGTSNHQWIYSSDMIVQF